MSIVVHFRHLALCLCVLFFVVQHAAGQNIPDEKILHYEVVALSLDSADVCPFHKIDIACDTLAVAFRKAITYYPELCDRKILLKYGRIKTSMAALPQILSIFRNRDKRTYRVVVNKDLRKAPARLIYDAPFNARTGVMGHELAHILDYSTKSGWQMAWTGVRYLGKKYRRKMEQQTDSIAIARGLGWQVYHFSYFVIYESEINEKYRRYKLDIYMKPEEIYEIISN
jgi:hypothetical protein